MKTMGAIALMLIGCGGVVGAGADDAGDAAADTSDSAPDAKPAAWCDTPLNDAGGVLGTQCMANGVVWTWGPDALHQPNTCADSVCPVGDVCTMPNGIVGTCQ